MIKYIKNSRFIAIVYAMFLSGFIQPTFAEDEVSKRASGDWYKVSQISDNTYMIEEPQSSQYNISYLIIGSEKALMLDTGSGENKNKSKQTISTVIKSLTDKPITLLMTHFHFDHNANIEEFDNIAFANIKDIRDKAIDDKTYYFSSKELAFGSYPEKTTVHEWIDLDTNIDLGSRIIKISRVRGHTDDSIIVIDESRELVFTGDTLYNGPLIVIGKENYDPYINTINIMKENFNDSFSFYGAHGDSNLGGGMNYSLLNKVESLLRCAKINTCEHTETISETLSGHLLNGDFFLNDGVSLIILDTH
ncbi:MBL fold metallo-hydrolase [Aliivibrio sp. S3MY1]|uniref:MBL fold metallo-hydrolase n=1 Tax=Aliivibrio sp. S3MY1 TaxID=3028424 RepID=UPI0023797598|nr:MBL fold metallo-hydrolase [Aliivibrio sp. S3MY1]MDD9195021.1 MBL fold metallo-hydrolase [Aliivibrio sp. S3MY1]